MQRTVHFAVLSMMFFFVAGCTAWERKPFFEADISGISIDSVHISRYEQVLFTVNPFLLYRELLPHHEEFYFFLGEELHDPEQQQRLYEYVTDPFLIELYLDTRDIGPDPDHLQKTLTQAFRFYAYHFPDEPLPRLYTYVSGIDHGQPVTYHDGHLIIAVDTYLGSDYPYYGKMGIPRYRSLWMREESIPVDVMTKLAGVHLHNSGASPETLLEHMIHEGKKLFFVDCMLPRTPDSLKISYTGSQMQWIRQNQGRAWVYKLDNELLYSSDHSAITKFIRDAPFTTTFSRQSAPRTGAWLGWQIVREYMRRNPGVSLPELMLETDARKILRESRYRP